MKKYSVIIPTYNKCDETLRPCLETLVKYTDMKQVEVIVVANGCTDNTEEFLVSMMKKHPEVRMLWSDEPMGYTRATNFGISHAQGEYIIPLNNDNEFLPQEKNEWIRMLEQPFLDSTMNVGITGPMMTDHRGRNFLIFFCVMIDRRVIDSIGDLDELFSPGYGEDTDFCFRAEDAGFQMVQVPYNTQTYFDVNQMTGGFPIWHKGNMTFKNWPGGEELLKKNNEILRERYFSDKKTDRAKVIKAWEPIVGKLSARFSDVRGWLSNDERTFLHEFARDKKVLEIGSYEGLSACYMASSAKTLDCVDTFKAGPDGQEQNGDTLSKFITNTNEFNNITPHVGMSTELAGSFEDGSFDLIFIDAMHDELSVMKDISCYWPKLKVGGHMLFHDYADFGQGVVNAVDNKLGKPSKVVDTIAVVEKRDMTAIDMLPIARRVYASTIPSDAVTINVPAIAQEIDDKLPVVQRAADSWHEQEIKVFDCFPFFNELDVLEIRFEELWNVVDRFIIVEATRTHSNQPKPLNFHNNLKRFEKYLSKVTYYVMEDIPAYSEKDTWTIERAQRECIMKQLNGCKDNDVIMISDVDEIPRASAVAEYKKKPQRIKCFEQRLSYYHLNCVSDIPWRYSVILPYSQLKELGPCGARYYGDAKGGFSENEIIKNGGWHFSYMGGADQVLTKINATAHQELNKPEVANLANINNALESGVDVYGRDMKYKFVEVDDTFPAYVVNKYHDFVYRGLIDERHDKSDRLGEPILYMPRTRRSPRVAHVFSAWGDIHTILYDIVNRFLIEKGHEARRALEFGVEWGFSTSAISNYFETVIGVDTFEGDLHSSFKDNHIIQTKANLASFPNIKLVKSDYRDFIKIGNKMQFDLIHIDIVHDYENTFACGDWAVQNGKVVIFHDTLSFPEVMRAVKDLATKHKLEFHNYPHSHGLGILTHPDKK